MPWMDLNDSDAHDQPMGWKDLRLFKQLWPYIKPHWKLLGLSILLLPAITLTQVAQPYLIKQAIDGPISHHQLSGLWPYVAQFSGIMVAYYLLRYWQMVLAQVAGQRIILSLRTALYNHLQSLPNAFYHQTRTGVLVTRISSDIENISEMFASGGLAIFTDIAMIGGILLAMALMNWPLALMAYCVVPLIVLTMEFFRRRSREAYNDIRVETAQLNTTLQESITGIEVLQLLQREAYNRNVFDTHSQKLVKSNIRSVVYDSAFTASVEVLSLTTLILVLGFVTGYLGIYHVLPVTLGILIAFLQYIQMLFEPIEELSDKFTIIQSGLASVDKVMDLMTVSSEINSPLNPQSLPQVVQGKIEFKNVTFGYHPTDPILKDISFCIQPGEKVAFIGATGAGKSTLIKLLNRQYDPQHGQILLDDTPIETVTLHDLRQNIVVIPQEDFLFSRSVAENITLDYPVTHSAQEIETVCKLVHADNVIQQLPQGLQTLLPERGRNLSNGERQLLVFARALWHQPKVLVLDEATSSIDPKTEALVQEALEISLSGRTAIMIAHRLSTIEQVDTIYVLSEGRIVEHGSPQQLLQQQGHYYAYYQQHTRERHILLH